MHPRTSQHLPIINRNSFDAQSNTKTLSPPPTFARHSPQPGTCSHSPRTKFDELINFMKFALLVIDISSLSPPFSVSVMLVIIVILVFLPINQVSTISPAPASPLSLARPPRFSCPLPLFYCQRASSVANRHRSQPGEGGLPGEERWSSRAACIADNSRSRKSLAKDRKMKSENVARSRGHGQSAACCVVQ